MYNNTCINTDVHISNGQGQQARTVTSEATHTDPVCQFVAVHGGDLSSEEPNGFISSSSFFFFFNI